MLTITGGKWTRRPIKTTARRKTRYTPQSARKALFDIVDVASKSFIDLFAGSGIMSFEAMSRGAAEAISVDVSKKACNLILDNRNELDPSMNLRIVCADFRRAIPSLISLSDRAWALTLYLLTLPSMKNTLNLSLTFLTRTPNS